MVNGWFMQSRSHLSSAVSRQAVNTARPEGSTYVVQICLPSLASTSQRSEEAPRKVVRKRLQPRASMPEGPAAPSVLSAVARIRGPVSWSKVTGWGSSAGGSRASSADGFNGWPIGCFSSRTSRTVLFGLLLGSISLSQGKYQ